MTDASEPTEPVAAVEPEPAAPPAAPAEPAPAHRSRTVEVGWLWLALGALGFLLLGSLLTFVGTKAADDDGPDFDRIAVQRGGGDERGPVGPGFGGPGMQGGPGFHGGPGFGDGGGPRIGPPDQGEQRDDENDGQDDEEQDDEEQDDTSDTDSSDTTDTTDTTS